MVPKPGPGGNKPKGVGDKGVGGDKVGDKVSKGRGQSKTSCVVCKATTNTIASNREGGVQCGVCDLWWHPTCANLAPERFKLIVEWTENGSSSPWKCSSCDTANVKMLKMINNLATRMDVTEKVLAEESERVDRVEEKDRVQDSRLDMQEKEIKALKEQVIRMGDMGGPSAVREMDERAMKGNNLVFYRVKEAGEGVDAKMRVDHDKVAIQHLLIIMELELDVEKATKVVRRLGARGNDAEGEADRDPRPLLVRFVHQHHTEAILDNRWRLSKEEDPTIQAVSVVKDLTMKQRASEREMHRLAFRKNLERSRENIEANLAFKVVGKRGSKREILAPLRDGETISEEGEVGWNRGDGARWRRPARGSSSFGPATYPNCLAVGTTGGGRGRGQSLATARGQSHQGRGAYQVFGRGGGSGGGRGVGIREEEEWTTVGRGGSVRRRAISGSPQGGGGPPVKKVDSKTSPTSRPKVNPSKYELPGAEGMDGSGEEVGRVGEERSNKAGVADNVGKEGVVES